MKLYHGCSVEHLRSILLNGLSPRADKKSNWKKAPSRSDMVYLTAAYPFYFALKHKGIVAVVEIDSARSSSRHYLLLGTDRTAARAHKFCR